MFGIDWNDPQTWWLNITNLGLGLLTVAAFAAIAYTVILDVLAKRRAAAADRHEALNTVPLGQERHVFHSPELGLTMADGGEPEPPAHSPQAGNK